MAGLAGPAGPAVQQGTGDALTPDTVRTWAITACRALGAARGVIDSANVFPVADADTGTNLCLTFARAKEEVDRQSAGASVGALLAALAHGALLGARGNSGVILSEYLRGLAVGAADDVVDAVVTARALAGASEAAGRAVADPRRGTILSAAEVAAACAATALADGSDVVGVLTAARDGARQALGRSADELDVLRAANVLDAGAYGLSLVLDALCVAAGTGSTAGALSEGQGTVVLMGSLSAPEQSADRALARPGRPAVDGEFEVVLVVEHRDGADRVAASRDVGGRLRRDLQELGESVVVVGGDVPGPAAAPGGAMWQVHVHTDRPEDVVRVVARDEDGRRPTVRQVVVRSLALQVVGPRDAGPGSGGVVACTTAPGLVADLARSGAVVVLRVDEDVTTADLRRAVLETGEDRVLVLPVDESSYEAARALAATGDGDEAPDALPRVTVAPPRTDLHVVAALAAWAGAPQTDRVTEALDAAGSVHVASVGGLTVAAAGATVAGRVAGATAGAEVLLTLLVDEEADATVVDEVVARAQDARPGTEVLLLRSGRASTDVLVGTEEL
ncbi:DAK2 domain-containing protein [Sanguibacter suaedae]|uniref:DAK2 domain-containing protein n=1 Tax=Sanguibacter suaedae TaxID=2795737 RepID=A0A934MAP6_9MICO|nr:DAK2 domain-containing protein [Sanguibacter suaedae]MBI9114461.1 DAK2 domain-containing protein [Sanguibacter suaedae]